MVELHSSISENVKGKLEQQRQNKKRRLISEQQGLILTDEQLTAINILTDLIASIVEMFGRIALIDI